MLLAVTRIPARTGFRLEAPACDWLLTLDNLALSLTKVPHIVLFGAFFLLTLVQFDRVGRTSLGLSLMATAAISIIVEIQQGATRTGNCRITDVAPNLFGGLIVAAFAMATVAVWRRLKSIARCRRALLRRSGNAPRGRGPRSAVFSQGPRAGSPKVGGRDTDAPPRRGVSCGTRLTPSSYTGGGSLSRSGCRCFPSAFMNLSAVFRAAD